MYPFKAVVISQDESVLPVLRRELANQNVEIEHEFADVASTLENLSLHHDETRLFICQPDEVHRDEFLRRLSGTFSGRPILVLTKKELNSLDMMHAMRNGASQVVTIPIEQEDFQQALAMVAIQFGHASSASKVIAITSGHGGVGATTLAVNMGYEIAQTYQCETIIAELSFNYGMLASYLTIQPLFNTLELLEYGEDIDIYLTKKALVPFGDRLSILAGPTQAVKSLTINPKTVSNLIEHLRRLAQVVILDVPSTLDEAQMTALDLADEVILVTDQTVPSLQSTAQALRLGIKSHSPWVVVNRFDPKIRGFEADRLKTALSVEKVRTVACDHEAVFSSVNCGQPLRFSYPKSKTLLDIDSLIQEVVQIQPKPLEPGGLLGIFKNFGLSFGRIGQAMTGG